MTLPNPYHLQYFVDAVELGSVSAAARRNLVGHPTVSQGIKSLEKHLGLQLLDHRKKRFEVTADGQALVERARGLLEGLSKLADASASPREELRGRVRLGLSRTLAHAFLSPCVARLESEYPGIRLEVSFGSNGELIEKSTRGALDLSLTLGHQPMATLRQTELGSGRFVIISPRSRNAPKIEASSRFILTEPRHETELLKKNFLKHFRAPLENSLEVCSWDVLSQLVADGLGFGLVPDITITPQKAQALQIHKLPWFSYGYQIYANELRSQPRSAVRAAVTGLVTEVARKAMAGLPKR
jgi:DNA-binding transcriptional LysR family regulator